MRPEAELLTQLRFALGAALVHLVGEHPRTDLPAAEAVAQAVGGEGLGGTTGTGSGVHPDPRPGDEPEWATHQATSSPASARAAARSRARNSRRACLVSARRSRPARFVSWRTWKRIRLRLSGAS